MALMLPASFMAAAIYREFSESNFSFLDFPRIWPFHFIEEIKI